MTIGELLLGLLLGLPMMLLLYLGVFGLMEWLMFHRPGPNDPPLFDAERVRRHHEFIEERERNLRRGRSRLR